MKLENIEKLINKFVTKEIIQRGNIRHDVDIFRIELVNGVKFKSVGYIHLTTSIGHCRYGTWTKFNIKIQDGSTKKQVMNSIKEYVEYFHTCARTSEAQARSFAEFYSTPRHQGNPIYLD